MNNNILIIAGEPSGDIRAGELIRELKKLLSGVSFWGIGAGRMEQEGVELIEHVSKLSIVGVWEAIKSLSKIREQYKNVTEEVLKRKPALAILVDYPGFNLKIASFLHKLDIPVVYYIIPQIWAWGGGRIKTIKKVVDKALVLFDFEEKLLKEAGIDCSFVGHPLLDAAPVSITDRAGKEGTAIALLPGSRKTEILSMFPVMLDAAENINKEIKNAHFVVAENSNIEKELYDSAISGHDKLRISRVTDNTWSCLDRSDFAIVTSGTATLETAVMEKPMVISYRTSPLTAFLFRTFASAPYIGLVNIMAGREVAPELLQEDATPENLSRKVLEIISDKGLMIRIKEELKKVKARLGDKGAAKKAAQKISEFIKAKGLP
ncbi:MAG: lipid-A-disaccharide synthase [Candidatus Omnitrophota bacterium]